MADQESHETTQDGIAANATKAPGVDNDGAKASSPISVSQFMMSNKAESIMWLLRVFTLVSTFFFLFPIFGVAEGGYFYQRALLANALISVCRLHQRLPRFQFSRAYITQALLEDSCHYFLYSLIFITSYPITLCLVPVAVFSLLHATTYNRKILDIIGPNSIPWMRSFLDKMTMHQQILFKFIACNEILLMAASVFMLLGGRAHLFLPFFYYRFMTLRYASRRNPYCRTLFYELRVATEQLTARPSCPTFLQKACHKVIKLICKLAPGS
ncbi:transmembrane protein 33-like isoform X1 [Amblyraja radiata]|uniref:transmembrane protein 33-like isoform X1 n=1 Tax=Amblyraja radiata TaxID=386614 RepID=UPI001403FEB2|nr:transmembrane protein 33-like isoform X1 [Amblyraja radiata]